MLGPSGIRAAVCLPEDTLADRPMSPSCPSSSQRSLPKTPPSTLSSKHMIPPGAARCIPSTPPIPPRLPNGALPAGAAQKEDAWASLHRCFDEGSATQLTRDEPRRRKCHFPIRQESPCLVSRFPLT